MAARCGSRTDPALNGELVPPVGIINCKPRSGGLGQPALPRSTASFRLRPAANQTSGFSQRASGTVATLSEWELRRGRLSCTGLATYAFTCCCTNSLKHVGGQEIHLAGLHLQRVGGDLDLQLGCVTLAEELQEMPE